MGDLVPHTSIATAGSHLSTERAEVIRHIQWNEPNHPHYGSIIINHLFFNTDSASHVAGVWIKQYDGDTMEMYLVPRLGFGQQIVDWNKSMNHGGCSTYHNVARQLREHGMNADEVVISLGGYMVRLPQYHELSINELKSAVTTLLKDPIVSEDHHIREALVQKMGEVLMSIKMLAAPSPQIEGRS